MEINKKKHPVASGVLLFFCGLSLLLSVLSGILRYTLSEKHIHRVITETKISELAIGEAVYLALQFSEDKVDDADYAAFVRHLDKDTTIADILYKVLKAENEDIHKKNVRDALEDKQFKKQLAGLIASYIDELLYARGNGELDADQVEDLMEAFYDGMRLSKKEEESDRAVLWKEAFLEVDREALEAYSMKHLAEVIPLTSLRVLVSAFFMIGTLATGILLLTAAIMLDYKTPKDALKKVLLVAAAEGILAALFLLVTHNCGEMLLRKNVEEMELGNSFAEVVENLNELDALERRIAAEQERRERQAWDIRESHNQPTPTPQVIAPQNGQGDVFNIYCYSEEFKLRMEEYYPGYVTLDDRTGQIGDIKIHFIIVQSADYAYQGALDQVLYCNDSNDDSTRADLFLLDADYAKEFTDENPDYAIPLDELGITDADLSGQYDFTKELVTDQSGRQRAVSWQAYPGVMLYNRDIALDVLGTDNPVDVQEAVKDWDAYYETAEKMADQGYLMTATLEDNYRVYYNNLSTPWVTNGKITIDPAMEEWARGAASMVAEGSTENDIQWSADWYHGFDQQGNVFCYFGPSWLYNFCTYGDDATSVAGRGRWGVTEGPRSFYWGGTWIAAARGTLHPDLAADIMRFMTTDETMLMEMAHSYTECVNNQNVMTQIAQDPAFSQQILGGQNPNEILDRAGTQVDCSNATVYDVACRDAYLSAMKQYITGQKSYEEACDLFYQTVESQYPELSH